MDTQILLQQIDKRAAKTRRAQYRAVTLAAAAIVLALAALLLTACSAPANVLRPTPSATAATTSAIGAQDAAAPARPAAFSLRATPYPTAPNAPQEKSLCTVTAHALTLRAAPNAESAPLNWLLHGETVTVTAPLPYPTGAWLAVDTVNLTGFVNSNFLTCEVTK